MACGADFTMIVNVMGVVYSMGCPEYGQLGAFEHAQLVIFSRKVSVQLCIHVHVPCV